MTVATRAEAVKAITLDAQQIALHMSLLGMLAALLIGIGKFAYHTVAFIAFIPVWLASGVKRGWQEASAADKAKRENARRAALIAQRARE